MGIQVGWDNDEQTVILLIFSGEWEWDDLHAAQAECRTLLDTAQHKVHFISDMGRAPRIPGNYYKQVTKLVQRIHPNTGLSITVTTNPLVKELFFAFSAMYGGVDFEYRFVQSLDEARTILKGWGGG